MRKLIRSAFLAALVISLPILMGVATKYSIEAIARAEARDFISDAGTLDDSQFSLELASRVHQVYVSSLSVPTSDYPFLYKIRPYLTNTLLPSWIRVEDGAIDSIFARGLCDSAARTLAFLLINSGRQIDAWQLNFVTRSEAHSVTGIRGASGTEWFVDPLYGIAPVEGNELIGAERAREISRNSDTVEDLWLPLAPSARPSFYSDFADVVFARQGQALEIRGMIDLGRETELWLGSVDGDSEDVRKDGSKIGISPHWNYFGHRYDRSWTRVIEVAQDTEIEFVMIDPVNPRFITTDVIPIIQGNSAIFRLAAGERLVFDDGAARRDWISLRSYQAVDAIIIRINAKTAINNYKH